MAPCAQCSKQKTVMGVSTLYGIDVVVRDLSIGEIVLHGRSSVRNCEDSGVSHLFASKDRVQYVRFVRTVFSFFFFLRLLAAKPTSGRNLQHKKKQAKPSASPVSLLC